ncbi:terminase TerL endonuclease subunit [Chelativorans sp. AA-79]|uniref:terminase large subunit n=1 Tax=Chelativorans sp. AA-79 TaxID=3028735 RepID=UPI0023F892B9|nr:terminase TerL endonuclease subunit [Chelativorans sp. AA-79]WEX07380.1 terminase large subunit [Chelativorans sp. AA-79]
MAKRSRRPRTPISARPAADDVATQFSLNVLDEKIVAGEFVKGACRRHLKDLDDGAARGLVYRPDKLTHATGFFPAVLTVTEGAKEGQPFSLLAWHEFVAGSLFGWYRSDGLRRFRMAWMETGKGQAKSPFMAAIGLYMMGFAGKQRSECYAIAGDKDQANVLFKDGVAMCRATMPDCEEGDSLESRGEVVIRGTADNAWKIEHPATGSKFQSLASGDSISGPRPYAVLADEIHEFKSSYALQVWKAAIDKVSGDPLMLLGTNTPATNQIVGTEYSEMFQKIALGQAVDDSLFGFIARVDKGDDPFNDERCWPKSLPALGVTYPIENVRQRVKTANLLLSEALSTKRLYFGIPVGTDGFWISEDAWKAVQGVVNEAEMAGSPCWLSLDLSKKNDLTALSACWRKGGHLYVKTWYFTTKAGIHDRARDDNAPYDQWSEKGLMEAVPGATIDYEFVAAKVQALCKEHDVQFLAFDAAKIGDFIDACGRIDFDVWKFEGPDEPTGDGLMLVGHGQGTRVVFKEKALCMPRSIEQLEDAILAGSITIDASPVTTMCAANAAIVSDAMNNRAFDKKKSRGRIDGMVSITEAVGAAHSELIPSPPASPWDDPNFKYEAA